MSYESFRAETVSKLLAAYPDPDAFATFLAVLDDVAQGFDFTRKTTDLIVYDDIPDAVRLYIASKSIENLSKGTLYNYYNTLKHFFSAVRKPVEDVTANDVRLYLHKYKESRHVMDSTLEGIRVAVNSFLEWCVDEDLIRKNPVRKIPPIRCGDPERLPMTALELETVRNSCKTLREKAMVDFMYSTAARVSEVSAMNIGNIDFMEHTARIEHGKGDKARTTFINAESEISLRAYLASRSDDNPALFVSSRKPHVRLSSKSLQNEVSRIVSRCSLSVHVTPHIFRHTAASLALQRGMPIDQVQKFLGHARIQTTLRYAKTLDFDVKLSHQRCVA